MVAKGLWNPEGGIMTKQPVQNRGVTRRDQILDAAACLLIEGGEGAVMMHAVATRAGASNGSMYHLFRNRQELLDGLLSRHTEMLVQLAPRLELHDRQLWRDLTARDAVDRLFGYALRYFADNADALYLYSHKQDRRFSEFQASVEMALTLRLGKKVGAAAARTLFAVSTGTLLYLQNMSPADRSAIIGSIPDVLTAYLADQDQAYCLIDPAPILPDRTE